MNRAVFIVCFSAVVASALGEAAVCPEGGCVDSEDATSLLQRGALVASGVERSKIEGADYGAVSTVQEARLLATDQSIKTRGILQTTPMFYGWMQKLSNAKTLTGNDKWQNRFITLEVNEKVCPGSGNYNCDDSEALISEVSSVILKWWEDSDAGYDGYLIGDPNPDRKNPQGEIELSGAKVFMLLSGFEGISEYIPEYKTEENPKLNENNEQLHLHVPPNLYESATTRQSLMAKISDGAKSAADKKFWKELWDVYSMSDFEAEKKFSEHQQLQGLLPTLSNKEMAREMVDTDHSSDSRDFVFKYSGKYWKDCTDAKKTSVSAGTLHDNSRICRKIVTTGENKGEPSRSRIENRFLGKGYHLFEPFEWHNAIHSLVHRSFWQVQATGRHVMQAIEEFLNQQLGAHTDISLSQVKKLLEGKTVGTIPLNANMIGAAVTNLARMDASGFELKVDGQISRKARARTGV